MIHHHHQSSKLGTQTPTTPTGMLQWKQRWEWEWGPPPPSPGSQESQLESTMVGGCRSTLKNLQLSILSKGVRFPNLPFFHHSLPKPDTVSMWNSSKRLASSPQGPWDGITDSPWNAIEKNRLKIICLVFSFFSTLRVLLHHLFVLSYLFAVIVAVLWLRLVFACSGSPHPHDEIDYKSKSQEGSTDPQKVALRR